MLAKPFGLNDIFQLTRNKKRVVPLAGIEPALLAESDFESDASTSSAIGATPCYLAIRAVMCKPKYRFCLPKHVMV